MGDDNWLKEYGFNVVALPRRDLRPGDVLLRPDGRFDQKAGNLAMVFESAEPVPDNTVGEPVAEIARTGDHRVQAGLGVKILGALFGGAVGSKLGAHLEGRHATRLAVRYEDVEQDSLPVLALDAWIQQAKVKLSGQGAIWLNNNKLAAITAVLRTAKLSVTAQRDDGASVELDLPEIQGLVGGEGKVSAESGSASKVTFLGNEPIAFGWQAFVLRFSGNVSFGLEQVRGVAPAPEQDAWTDEEEIDEVADAQEALA